MEKVMRILTQSEIKSLIYKDKTKSYTYGLCRDDGTLYYVGVGIRSRALVHVSQHELLNGTNKLKTSITKKEIKNNSPKFVLFVIHKSREFCLDLEKKLISNFKRIAEGGILSNLTDGGEIGPTGVIVSDETKKKLSSIRTSMRDIHSEKNKLWWNSLSDEEKQLKINKMRSGTNNDSARTKISKATSERWADPAYKKRLSQIQKESQKKNADVTRENMKLKWADPKYRAKMLEARKIAREKKLAEKAIQAERQSFANEN
jgi:hypothetical protein